MGCLCIKLNSCHLFKTDAKPSTLALDDLPHEDEAMDFLFEFDRHTAKPTHFDKVFQSAVQYLHDQQISYVLSGTLALNTFINARYCNEIELICDCDATDVLADALKQRVLQQTGLGGEFKLWNRVRPAMVYALAYRKPKNLFGVRVDCPTALALCWLLLESHGPYAEINVGSLLLAGLVDMEALQRLLEQNANQRTRDQLKAAKVSILRGEFSGDYSESVRARLLRRQQKGQPEN